MATVVALLMSLIALAGCSRPAGHAKGGRLYFCDDLRIHSVLPDGGDPWELAGKPSSCPIAAGAGEIFCASYRGPYYLVDPLRPGIFSLNPREHRRRRLTDWPVLPVLCGFAAEGRLAFFQAAGPAEFDLLDTRTAEVRRVRLPGPPAAAAVSPTGDRAAVALAARLRTVVLGNQAWFTEGSDVTLVPLGGGDILALEYPLLPGTPPMSPSLDHYAGGGLSALAWRDAHALAVSSSPGIWILDPDHPSSSSVVRLRSPGQPLADGLAFSSDGNRLAITAGGRLIVREIATGAERDVTPPGLVGGAHHPCWSGD